MQEINGQKFDLQFIAPLKEDHLVKEVLKDLDKDATFNDPEVFLNDILKKVKDKSLKLFNGIELDNRKLAFLVIRQLSLKESFYAKN